MFLDLEEERRKSREEGRHMLYEQQKFRSQGDVEKTTDEQYQSASSTANHWASAHEIYTKRDEQFSHNTVSFSALPSFGVPETNESAGHRTNILPHGSAKHRPNPIRVSLSRNASEPRTPAVATSSKFTKEPADKVGEEPSLTAAHVLSSMLAKSPSLRTSPAVSPSALSMAKKRAILARQDCATAASRKESIPVRGVLPKSLLGRTLSASQPLFSRTLQDPSYSLNDKSNSGKLDPVPVLREWQGPSQGFSPLSKPSRKKRSETPAATSSSLIFSSPAESDSIYTKKFATQSRAMRRLATPKHSEGFFSKPTRPRGMPESGRSVEHSIETFQGNTDIGTLQLDKVRRPQTSLTTQRPTERGRITEWAKQEISERTEQSRLDDAQTMFDRSLRSQRRQRPPTSPLLAANRTNFPRPLTQNNNLAANPQFMSSQLSQQKDDVAQIDGPLVLHAQPIRSELSRLLQSRRAGGANGFIFVPLHFWAFLTLLGCLSGVAGAEKGG